MRAPAGMNHFRLKPLSKGYATCGATGREVWTAPGTECPTYSNIASTYRRHNVDITPAEWPEITWMLTKPSAASEKSEST